MAIYIVGKFLNKDNLANYQKKIELAQRNKTRRLRLDKIPFGRGCEYKDSDGLCKVKNYGYKFCHRPTCPLFELNFFRDDERMANEYARDLLIDYKSINYLPENRKHRFIEKIKKLYSEIDPERDLIAFHLLTELSIKLDLDL